MAALLAIVHMGGFVKDQLERTHQVRHHRSVTHGVVSPSASCSAQFNPLHAFSVCRVNNSPRELSNVCSRQASQAQKPEAGPQQHCVSLVIGPQSCVMQPHAKGNRVMTSHLRSCAPAIQQDSLPLNAIVVHS